jgi:hypothetical protein
MKFNLTITILLIFVIHFTCSTKKLKNVLNENLVIKNVSNFDHKNNTIYTKQWTPEELVENFASFNNIYDPDKILIKINNKKNNFSENIKINKTNSFGENKKYENSNNSGKLNFQNLQTSIDKIKNKTFSIYNDQINPLSAEFKLNPILVIINEISDEFLNQKTFTKNSHLFLKKFSKLLLKKFSLNEDYTIIILISINDKAVNFRLGTKLREKLRQEFLNKNSVENILKNPDLINQLENHNYTQAINFIFDSIINLLEKKEENLGKILFVLFVPVILVTIYYSLRSCLMPRKYIPMKNNGDKSAINVESSSLKVNKIKNKNNDKAMNVEEILKKFQEFNSMEKSPNETECKICIICLMSCCPAATNKENDKEEENILVTEEVQLEPITILDCNHIYHYDCLKYWYSIENKKCPTCRFNEGVMPSQDPKSQFLNIVVQIQMIICIDLELFDMKVEDGKIKWVFPEIEETSKLDEIKDQEVVDYPDPNKKMEKEEK